MVPLGNTSGRSMGAGTLGDAAVKNILTTPNLSALLEKTISVTLVILIMTRGVMPCLAITHSGTALLTVLTVQPAVHLMLGCGSTPV